MCFSFVGVFITLPSYFSIEHHFHYHSPPAILSIETSAVFAEPALGIGHIGGRLGHHLLKGGAADVVEK